MTPPAAPPAGGGSTPSVPYGPGPAADAASDTGAGSGVTAASAGRTALKWGVRLALPFVLRAVFRGLAGR